MPNPTLCAGHKALTAAAVGSQTSKEQEAGAQPEPQQHGVHIKELSFQACGTERTNPSFIQRLWHPECPTEAADATVRGAFDEGALGPGGVPTNVLATCSQSVTSL